MFTFIKNYHSSIIITVLNLLPGRSVIVQRQYGFQSEWVDNEVIDNGLIDSSCRDR
jgi:hypothetical protein